jgi:hypothetical protein
MAKILINTSEHIPQGSGCRHRWACLGKVLGKYTRMARSNTGTPIRWVSVAKLGQDYKLGHVAISGCRSWTSR